MSGVGFWELILVFLMGLIVLGPERLPRVAHQLGTWLGQARRMTRVMRRQLEDELNLEKELSIRPQNRPLPPKPSPRRHDDDDSYSPAHDAAAPGTGTERAAGDDEAPRSDAQQSDAASPEQDSTEPPPPAKNP